MNINHTNLLINKLETMQNNTSCIDEIIQEITDMYVISAGNTPNEYNK